MGEFCSITCCFGNVIKARLPTGLLAKDANHTVLLRLFLTTQGRAGCYVYSAFTQSHRNIMGCVNHKMRDWWSLDDPPKTKSHKG